MNSTRDSGDIGPHWVLLVEDNQAHVELIARELSRLRPMPMIAVAESGKEAHAYIANRGQYAGAPVPHLVLLDMKLPGIGGIEILRVLKESPRLKHVPVVVLTTTDGAQDRAKAYAAGANSCLVKPTDAAELRSLIAAIHQYWIHYNRPAQDSS